MTEELLRWCYSQSFMQLDENHVVGAILEVMGTGERKVVLKAWRYYEIGKVLGIPLESYIEQLGLDANPLKWTDEDKLALRLAMP